MPAASQDTTESLKMAHTLCPLTPTLFSPCFPLCHSFLLKSCSRFKVNSALVYVSTRSTLEEKRKLEEQQQRIRTKQKQRTKSLQKLVTTRAEANDPHQSLAQVSKSKLRTFRYLILHCMRDIQCKIQRSPSLWSHTFAKSYTVQAARKEVAKCSIPTGKLLPVLRILLFMVLQISSCVSSMEKSRGKGPV